MKDNLFIKASVKNGELHFPIKATGTKHAMIREIAQEIGYTFEEAKLAVKRAAGLCFVRDKQEYCKSFGDCDKDELNLAIQACVEIGDFNGMQLR